MFQFFYQLFFYLICIQAVFPVQAFFTQLMLSSTGFYCAVKPSLKHSNLTDTYNYEHRLNSQTY